MPDFYKVSLTEKAKSDVREIFDYLENERGNDFAIGFIDNLLKQIDTLEQFPFRCPSIPEVTNIANADYRHLMLPPFRIVYKITDKNVIILIVADGRRDMTSLLRDRLIGY